MIQWFEKRSNLSFIILIIIAIGIFYVSSLRFEQGGAGSNINSILYHFTAFFFFAGFLLIFLVRGKFNRLIPIAFVMAVLYAISDEIHQYFVPNRAMSLGDVFVDSVGIVLAILVYLVSLEFRK